MASSDTSNGATAKRNTLIALQNIDMSVNPIEAVQASDIHTEDAKTAVDIAIIGGGIGGLALAIGLQQYDHVRVKVYEAAAKFSEIGGMFSAFLSWKHDEVNAPH